MDGLIIVVVVALVLFGSTQIPKLARSLGSAKTEFKQGLAEGESPDVAVVVSPAQGAVVPAVVQVPPADVRVASDASQ